VFDPSDKQDQGTNESNNKKKQNGKKHHKKLSDDSLAPKLFCTLHKRMTIGPSTIQ
jgi:hypothetical protein